ncbi:MAG TPA: zinc ribbon domain-containing protein [Anaerolineae bacterium]
MPLYEYYCTDCRTTFDRIRPMNQADAPVECKNCESSHTSRTISIFAAHLKGDNITSTAMSTNMSNFGGGCCGGACGCGH